MDAPVQLEAPPVWRPLLGGALASRARDVAREIALALADHKPSSLSDAADAAVFWAHAAAAFDERWADRALEHALEDLRTALRRGVPSLALFGGLTGAAWAAHHVAGADAGPDEPEDLPPRVDQRLVDALSASAWGDRYDLISGLAGFGVYLVARRGRPLADQGLALCLAHLEALAQSAGPGLAWKTPPALLPDHQRQVHPTGVFDLGVAHGTAGVIGVYAAVLETRALPQRDPSLRRSLAAAIAFLESQRHADRDTAAFEWCAESLGPERAARTAWCYGDLGIAIVLLRAARVLDDPALHERAVALGRACATRRDDRCGVVDAGVCHGRAGLGHLLNRLFQATGDPIIEEGARRWFERTLQHRVDHPIAGFPALAPSPATEPRPTWHPDPSILSGAAGVGLSLLSALGESPAWDQPLLTELR